MKTADESSTDAAGTPAKAVPTRTTPLFKLKRPVTREDVPQLMSAANLFKGALKGELSERQQQCLAKDPSVGSLYKTAMVRDETTTYDIFTTARFAKMFSLCSDQWKPFPIREHAK